VANAPSRPSGTWAGPHGPFGVVCLFHCQTGPSSRAGSYVPACWCRLFEAGTVEPQSLSGPRGSGRRQEVACATMQGPRPCTWRLFPVECLETKTNGNRPGHQCNKGRAVLEREDFRLEKVGSGNENGVRLSGEQPDPAVSRCVPRPCTCTRCVSRPARGINYMSRAMP